MTVDTDSNTYEQAPSILNIQVSQNKYSECWNECLPDGMHHQRVYSSRCPFCCGMQKAEITQCTKVLDLHFGCARGSTCHSSDLPWCHGNENIAVAAHPRCILSIEFAQPVCSKTVVLEQCTLSDITALVNPSALAPKIKSDNPWDTWFSKTYVRFLTETWLCCPVKTEPGMDTALCYVYLH